ncbi:hypothetical protein LCGC14_0338540 [marine sediment metagenome]|uniref:Uncharacterized protein n=1 Tax=marine sediment metagenome TaxID=412755 RepID=A0A0F9TEL1_9ZZZZ
MAMAFDKFQKLDSFLKLEPGWDSYGAPAISRKALFAAQNIMFHLLTNAPSFIGPTSHGGVHLEWNHGGYSIEIEIGPNGKISEACFFDD